MIIKPIETITIYQIDKNTTPVGIVIERLELDEYFDEYLLTPEASFNLLFLNIENKRTSCAAPKEAFNSNAFKKVVKNYISDGAV